ncbi:MAG: response regulator [Gemmatimonadetes bacterium]|nr:response regulator [Gemmatimonadota bacterium]
MLIIDDETIVADVLARTLRRAGYACVEVHADPWTAADAYGRVRPDLLILDLHMPGLDGFGVLERLRAEIPEDTFLPIIVLTADDEPATRRRALAAGAADFVVKPFEEIETLLRIRNLITTRSLHLQERLQTQELERRIQERTHELQEAQLEILERLALAAEYHDDATGEHTRRVADEAARLARELGRPEPEVELIRRAALLHDVGKIGIPEVIQSKQGPLTAEEFLVMKRHTLIGERILAGSQFPVLQMARDIAVAHHERWDGSGYPHGLRGEEIPLAARIVAVADVYDALTHERPYKAAWTPAAALEEIRRTAGQHFDPAIVEAFLRLHGERERSAA